ncbi:MAG: Re/Si-specific NAD(P)(+) transhydrogenase subunit alpha [Alphaproteobacteria bacterium]|nr:Re/Si-specific NAD(P)(+) transhydrogenase subunit alpha [Alphaproteobacteria bacterium]
MKLAVLKERGSGEARVAVTPEIARKYIQAGFAVALEAGAGLESEFSDDVYAKAGVSVSSAAEALAGADILLAVRPPEAELLQRLPENGWLIGMLEPHRLDAHLPSLSQRGLTAFSLELLPRISRAQGMDVLSSQSNLAGYRAVIEAVAALRKAVPMMMTAAGTVAPAKALVLGAGVAGLQAIATARRLGAVVTAFDVRAAAKEQVESLGAKFIAVASDEKGEAKGGYAKEMSEDYQRRQRELIHEVAVKQDMIVTTALVPGKPAPVLITEETVRAMKPGAVIVDLAAASGGNCPLTEPDQAVDIGGVTLIGFTNLPSRVAADASPLYARNLFNFVTGLLVKDGRLEPNWDDELITGTMLTRNGQVVHAGFR